jgi:hypothetical protein
MKFMIIVKASPESEDGAMPDESVFEAMADYHEELAAAGALVDAAGLHPSSDGFRIRYADGERYVVDGPFPETKELVAGYTIIEVGSSEEARQWALRFPNPQMEDGEIEVRRLYELDDFEPNPAIERFRKLESSR